MLDVVREKDGLSTADNIEKLSAFQRKVKYGVSSLSEAMICEEVIDDRMIAKEIVSITGMAGSLSDPAILKFGALANREAIEKYADSLPAYCSKSILEWISLRRPKRTGKVYKSRFSSAITASSLSICTLLYLWRPVNKSDSRLTLAASSSSIFGTIAQSGKLLVQPPAFRRGSSCRCGCPGTIVNSLFLKLGHDVFLLGHPCGF